MLNLLCYTQWSSIHKMSYTRGGDMGGGGGGGGGGTFNGEWRPIIRALI